MRRYIFLMILVLMYMGSANADTPSINLDCEKHGDQLVQRLLQEQVVDLNRTQAARIEQLAVELCVDSEQVASVQHKELEAAAVKKWFTSDHLGGKKGNERLKRLK